MTNELLVKPEKYTGRVEDFGYQYLALRAWNWRQAGGTRRRPAIAKLALVVMGGRCTVETSRGEWRDIGGRPTFSTGGRTRCTCRRARASGFRRKQAATWPCAFRKPRKSIRGGW